MKVDLSKVEVGDKIWTFQEGWTEVLDKDENFVYILDGICYPFDGFYCEDHAHASAFLEYPFGIEEIEKDTLVYYRDHESQPWSVGYYDCCDDGRHFVFDGSKKEAEAEDSSIWNMIKTQNPLK